MDILTRALNVVAEQGLQERATVDVVRGVEPQCPSIARSLEPTQVVHEPRDLQRVVAGARDAQELGALQAVLEDRETTFVVGVARRPQRVEQRVHVGERLAHNEAASAPAARSASATRVRVGP